MPLFDIKMPKLGESITEGTIMRWNVKVGDMIKEDNILFEVSTQKVSAEIPSPINGTVSEILFQINETIEVGTVVARILPEGEVVEQIVPENETLATPKTDVKPIGAEPKPSASSVKKDRFYSPLIIQMAKDADISFEALDTIQGTGYEGRVSKQDLEHYLDLKSKGRLDNTPATKPVAKSVDRDVASEPLALNQEDEVMDMDFIRKITADHMVLSKKTSPHVTSIIEIDVTKLVHWYEKNKADFLQREGVKLTYTPAITEAVAKALIDFPRVNSSVDGYKIIQKKQIHVGIAVSLDSGNLVVPVIHHADEWSLSGLAHQIDDLAKKARSNKLSPDDISGGTFTITNYGVFKTLFATPIINQPQVAILGVGYIEKKPAVVTTPDGDMIAIRHKMYLSLSYDHRIIDGALGGNFLRRIGDYLENWDK